jgi:alkylation response protein AidB-like acyl-CoA dehydrogenase
MAVTDRAAAQHGISAFIFDRGTPGFRLGRKENKLGMRASSTGEVIFENCLAALSVGTAQGAYDVAFKYSRQRRQFGRHISEFQAIQFKLADMAASVDAARLLALRAGYLKDQGRRVTKESAIAKLFASETAVQVAEQAVQVLGGYGLIKDYRVEKFYRDVKLCTIGEGTSEIQRLVIARQLLKD